MIIAALFLCFHILPLQWWDRNCVYCSEHSCIYWKQCVMSHSCFLLSYPPHHHPDWAAPGIGCFLEYCYLPLLLQIFGKWTLGEVCGPHLPSPAKVKLFPSMTSPQPITRKCLWISAHIPWVPKEKEVQPHWTPRLTFFLSQLIRPKFIIQWLQ